MLRQLALNAAKWMSAVTDPALGRRRGPRILIYHQVGEDNDLEMNVSLHDFEQQMEWLQLNGEIVDLWTAVERIGSPEGDHTYVITFDDGHVSVFEKAFPVMSGMGLPFMLYLTTGPLEDGAALHGDERMPLMNWGQVETVLSSGVATVGAHSHQHLDMRMHEESVIEADIVACNNSIEQRLGLTPEHFAYPWGHWSAQADPHVRRVYHTAAIGSGSEIRRGADLHHLSRIPVMRSDGDYLFQRKMWGGFRLETRLREFRDKLAT